MPKSVFPYPGGKARHADWILDHLPNHECYVEPFGGGAGVLLNKEPSTVEIYNDIDGNLAAFFRALRDHTEDLLEWLQHTPYSREMHAEFRETLYGDGDPPNSDVERGGMFFFLQCASFGGKRGDSFAMTGLQPSGKWRDLASSYHNSRQQLSEFADRFNEVTVENRTWAEIVDKYDAHETLFYLDPPYYGTESYYGREFNHRELSNTLRDIDGRFILSYSDTPPCFEDWGGLEIRTRESRETISHSGDGEQIETLLMNYDPRDTPRFESAGQLTVHDL